MRAWLHAIQSRHGKVPGSRMHSGSLSQPVQCTTGRAAGRQVPGACIRTSLCSSRGPSRSSTRPATLRSRSNQVCHRPPPYGSTLSVRKPDLAPLECGFSFRQGLQGMRSRHSTTPQHCHRSIAILITYPTFPTPRPRAMSSSGQEEESTSFMDTVCMHAHVPGSHAARVHGHGGTLQRRSSRRACRCARRPCGSRCRPHSGRPRQRRRWWTRCA